MQISIELVGASPLIPKGDRLANPLDDLTQEIAAINEKGQKKTDSDRERIALLEFKGALYYSSNGPIIPGANLLASFRDGGRRVNLGKRLLSALLLDDVEIPLEYPGPRDLETLAMHPGYRFIRSVVNSGRSAGRVMRCRPIFRKWSLKTTADLDEDELNFGDLVRIVEAAGRFAGLGEWRPSLRKGGQYGRYIAKIEEIT